MLAQPTGLLSRRLPAALARQPRLFVGSARAAQQAEAAANKPELDAEEGGSLFQPFQLGPYTLKHRVVMAPLTRCRAIDTIPRENAVKYYAQRATPGGFLISEATCIAAGAEGYPHTPGIYREEQLQGWRPVVQAVREKGGVFFLQLWHCGRSSTHAYQPDGGPPVSASAIPITDGTKVFNPKTGQQEDFPTPRALELNEIPQIVEQYRTAARNAMAVGFHGVEVHGANGYLIDQFLKDESNQRTDAYGDSIENRCRFALEVVKAVAEEVGADKVGIRLSPFGGFQNNSDSHPYSLTVHLLEELNKLGLAYCHLVEPRAGDAKVDSRAGESGGPGGRLAQSTDPFRQVYGGSLVAAGGYTRASGMGAVASGHADLVAFGRWFIANPDLPLRLCLDAPLNRYHRETFYSQGDEGYTDYPALEETEEGREFLEERGCPRKEHEP